MMVKMISIDSGMVVVIFICIGFVFIVIALLFFVKNEWCDILFRNMTVRYLSNSVWIRHQWNNLVFLQRPHTYMCVVVCEADLYILMLYVS